MLGQRLVTGLLFIIGLVGLLWLDAWVGPIALGNWHLPAGLFLAVLGSIVVALGACELTRVAAAAGIRTDTRLTAAASVAVMIATWLSVAMPMDFDATVPLTVIVAALVLSLLRFSHGKQVQDVFAATAVVLLAVVYLGVLSGFLLLIGAEISIWMIGGVALVVKACDIGAYFTGRAVGRHKLIPWLSPGKTWEGLAGGVAASMLAAFILDAIWDFPLAWWWVLVMGGVLAVVGQAGDLTMSLFKRGAGLKDSSSLLPGLGGVMDVIDSLLLASPVAWWMLHLSLIPPA